MREAKNARTHACDGGGFLVSELAPDEVQQGVLGLSQTATAGTAASRKRSRSSEAEAEVCAWEAKERTKGAVSHIHTWDVDQVVAMFERHNFPSEGVRQGQVDGKTLVSLFRDGNAEELFTAAPPNGLGFSKLLFRGRFAAEMRELLADR
jgi:hypothetical protein